MRTAINFISWGVFLMLAFHMTETKEVTRAQELPAVRYVYTEG